jgi:hypothetical protein
VLAEEAKDLAPGPGILILRLCGPRILRESLPSRKYDSIFFDQSVLYFSKMNFDKGSLKSK